jgi:hypothetical protein
MALTAKTMTPKPEPFLKPRLVGARFEGGAIPLEVLADFAVLEQMIVEIAKWKYRQQHPERKRVPRGFTDEISLKITEIEEGSAIPFISLFVASTLLPVSQPYFDEARSALIGAIGAAEHNTEITRFLPQKLLGYFDRFGRSLREGEAIEFAESSSGALPAKLTKETRRKLLLASSEDEVTSEIVIDGLIPEADQETNTFSVRLMDGTKVKAPLSRQHFDTIVEAFNNYKQGMRIRMYASGRFDRFDHLKRIASVEHVSVLDPLDVGVRTNELRMLRNGWLDGKGIAPSSNGLQWLAEVFDANFPDDLPLPYLYPTPEGGVRAEWSLRPYESSLDIDLAKHIGTWHSLNLDNDAEQSEVLKLDDPKDWTMLASKIRQMAGVKA